MTAKPRKSLVDFADAVKTAASRVKGKPYRFGDKVFLAAIGDALDQKPLHKSTRDLLVEAHRAGLIVLSRADLTSAFPADVVRASRVAFQLDGRDVAEWHLIDAPLARANPRRGRRGRRRNPSGAAVDRAARGYRAAHWGLGGKWKSKSFDVPDVEKEVPVVMGLLTEITYRTTKGGDGGEADYHHKFSAPYPVLAFTRAGLVIGRFAESQRRSKYRVTWRGIVG